jgi:hypothetical protein
MFFLLGWAKTIQAVSLIFASHNHSSLIHPHQAAVAGNVPLGFA